MKTPKLTKQQNEDGKFGFVDTDGNWAIEPKFDDAEKFINGLAKVKVDGKYGFIKPDGSYLYEPQFLDAFMWGELGIVKFEQEDEDCTRKGWTFFRCDDPSEDLVEDAVAEDWWWDLICKPDKMHPWLEAWSRDIQCFISPDGEVLDPDEIDDDCDDGDDEDDE